MKLNFAERLLVNNSARALVQRFYEGPLLRKLGGSVEGLRVLDVGCGRGVGVQLLLQQFGAVHVHGIDLDPKQIERAQRRLTNRFGGRFTLGIGGVERLPFESEMFDAVFDFGMLHHVPVWQDGIAEIRRVLKPGGRFFFEEVTKMLWRPGFIARSSNIQQKTAEFVNTVLDAAIETMANRDSRPVIHSHRGAHYRWPGWLTRISDAGLVRSMSRKGCTPDNAACEGFSGD